MWYLLHCYDYLFLQMMTLLPGHQTNNHVNIFVLKLCTNGTSLLVQLHPVLLAMICLSGLLLDKV